MPNKQPELDELSIVYIQQLIEGLSKIEKVTYISALDLQAIIKTSNELVALRELCNLQSNNKKISAFFEKSWGNNNNNQILNEDGNIAGAEPPSESPSFIV